MLTLRKVVAPIDFSRRSIEAADYAAAIARHCGSELTLLHVVDPPRLEFAMLEPPSGLMAQMMAERITKVSAELDDLISGHFADVDAKRNVLEGEPADVIVKYCVEQHVDLVVMPTRGRNPLRHFIIGSVAAKVLHDAPCAVLTGVHLERDFEFPQFNIDHVLCAVDFGPHSAEVLRWGAEIASDFQARFTAMHVTGGASADPHDRKHSEWMTDHTNSLKQKIEQLLASTSASATGEVVVRVGEPHKEVSQVARGLKVDLVVIGRGSSDGMLGRLRANSYAIVREAPCPVLSL
jgi:nucleotide-binding universal stress UspA family protein